MDLPSRYIRSPHPKTTMRPDQGAFQRVLDRGWIAQYKIHGHRAQCHLSANTSDPVLVYNRQGKLHKKELPDVLCQELRRLFAPQDGWTVIEGEWLKGQDKIFLFDILRKDGQLLNHLSYGDRYEFLPRVYQSDNVETLGIWRSAAQCFSLIEEAPPYVEGFVLKAWSTKGFHDTSVIRCRWPGRSIH
ncbi:hypothetical protein [Pseudobacteriovorax antillogorgiicola]|uniref:RNA ligase n=1 Tax=Pseudobacteriovorax antillogorgiicola TaxID=1513793 RepID=A0A1Y6BD35_9BACT|nr:hypothetical protein [Pseudobacteriovorax antillogorgiicola]TCS56454.1 hypothetical protein EDD56_104276 [Pseudobacteriovorax antillogorgiicola]SMF05270.1 hypothetical protein SAMN06296036_10457 [Pseudobacteriovorax antillogorgiicola]